MRIYIRIIEKYEIFIYFYAWGIEAFERQIQGGYSQNQDYTSGSE